MLLDVCFFAGRSWKSRIVEFKKSRTQELLKQGLFANFSDVKEGGLSSRLENERVCFICRVTFRNGETDGRKVQPAGGGVRDDLIHQRDALVFKLSKRETSPAGTLLKSQRESFCEENKSD